MNRFVRSAFFPLIVIVVLVWLASQTLIPKGENEQKLTYSQLKDRIEAGDVQDAVFQASTSTATGKVTPQQAADTLQKAAEAAKANE